MNMNIMQINSLEKVRLNSDMNFNEISKATVLKGERFSYQLALKGDWALLEFHIKSELEPYISLYSVENMPMDYPLYDKSILETDDDYITKEPGLMPDLLLPLKDKGGLMKLVQGHAKSLWICVDIPEDIDDGSYDIDIFVKSNVKDGYGNAVGEKDSQGVAEHKIMTLDILNAVIPKQELIYSQWFHVDCISDVHKVEIYSEEHWRLIDNYMKTARDTGINMLMMPIITPPLDTKPYTTRPCVQLVDIKKTKEGYSFDFEKVHRWISLCKKNGIKYYEMAHLFSQWGSEFSPSILIDVEGEKKYYFTWGIGADSDEYKSFLAEFIPALLEVLKREAVLDYTYFHISDEPNINNYQNYERCSNILKPLIGGAKTCDALSEYKFYENGLVDCPITPTNHIDNFLEHDVPNQWAYYCCGNLNLVGNRMLAMPSHRNRILGLQMYKFDIKGFLQWGYNFYNAELSAYRVNPYMSTSGDLSFPSGDAFTVYPGEDGAYLSLRALVFYEGLQDISACRLLETYIGKEKVVELMEALADMEITFTNYPRNSKYLPDFRERIYEELKKYI